MSCSFIWMKPVIERMRARCIKRDLLAFAFTRIAAVTNWDQVLWMTGKCWIFALRQPVIHLRTIHISITKRTHTAVIFLLIYPDELVTVEALTCVSMHVNW